MESPRFCPTCGATYGKRTRCYRCNPGKKRTGQERSCKECGSSFYAARWQLADTARNQGTYCSRACLTAAKTKMPNWRRDASRTTQNNHGYLLVWVGHEHPYAMRGRLLEHRLVMEKALGRYLTREEHVHHINGDKVDNRLENLRLMTPTEHQQLHAATDHIHVQPRHITLTCKRCTNTYLRKPSRAAESNYCSAACRLEAQHDAARAYWAAKRRGDN